MCVNFAALDEIFLRLQSAARQMLDPAAKKTKCEDEQSAGERQELCVLDGSRPLHDISVLSVSVADQYSRIQPDILGHSAGMASGQICLGASVDRNICDSMA